MNSILVLWLVGITLAAITLCLATILKSLESWRRLIGESSVGMLLASLPFLLFGNLDWLWLGLTLMGHFTLLILAFRLIVGRLPVEFLRRSTPSNSLIILGYCWLVTIIGLFFTDTPARILAAVVLVVTIFNLYLFVQALIGYQRYQVDKVSYQGELPTVSLCIPARNEDHALTECLEMALASDYPKLEILVLDDCSQDKTSQLVRSFAHDGVQFIQGETPAQGWLGKNQAQEALAKQANGEIVIFMGVDTRLSPQSISRLVSYMQHYKLEMLSVLAQRLDGLRESTLLAQLRYYWQIMLPMRSFRVPVSSQLWLIKRKTLQNLGGFAAVRHKIVPEGSFARRLHSTGRYRFVISDSQVGLSTTKKWSSQLETGIRLLYPTYKRQPYIALGASLYLLAQLLAPAVVITSLTMNRYGGLFFLGLAGSLLWWLSYVYYIRRVLPEYWQAHCVLALFIWPLLVLQELTLGIISMLRYEFSDVNWKGRNVCYPVIHPPVK